MKTTVLTRQGQPVQVVEVSDGTRQIAIVTIGGKPNVNDVVWVRPWENPGDGRQADSFIQMIGLARRALRERDSVGLRVLASRMRSSVVTEEAVHDATLVEITDGGRARFRFTWHPRDCSPQRLQVTLREVKMDETAGGS